MLSLIRLADVDRQELTEWLEDAWLLEAPARVRKAFLDNSG